MRRLIIILIAVAAIAVQASAQIPATFNNAEKSTMSNGTSQADDSLLARIRIFPNPSSGILRVSIDDADMNVLSQGEAVIYNSSGQLVVRKPYTTGTNDFYINNLSNGIYFLRLMPKSSGFIAVKEFAVAR